MLCISLCACGSGKKEPPVTDTLTLWCTADAPITAAIGRLIADYNDLPGQTMPVSLKVFSSEAAMAEAFNSMRPDLLLCTHHRAANLRQSAQLSVIPGLEDALAAVMNSGFESFFDGSFIPLGAELPLLLCAPGANTVPGTISELLELVSGKDGMSLGISSWADVFAAASCRGDYEFCCELSLDRDSEFFSELYNGFAELAYGGRLCFSPRPEELVVRGELPYAIVSSCALAELSLDNCTVGAMPDLYETDTQFMSSVWGFAVTAGAGRSAKAADAFVSWLMDGSRLGDTAVACGLLPAAASTLRTTPLRTALFDIYRSCELYMSEGDSPFYTGREDFDREVSTAMAHLY